MGKRLNRKELLSEIATERARLDGQLTGLVARQMTVTDVTAAGWSVKDILGHLVGWQELNLGWHESELRGATPEVPAPGFGWGDVPKLNAKIFRTHQRRSLKTVRRDYESFHQKMLDLIESVPEENLIAIGHYSWTGKSWGLSDYIRANTASHYRWACIHIRRWIRNGS
jgi:hypothetical protein